MPAFFCRFVIAGHEAIFVLIYHCTIFLPNLSIGKMHKLFPINIQLTTASKSGILSILIASRTARKKSKNNA